jgi:hypothetical protein
MNKLAQVETVEVTPVPAIKPANRRPCSVTPAM